MVSNRSTRLEITTDLDPTRSDNSIAITHAGRTVSAHQPGSSGDVAFAYDAFGRSIATQQPGHAHAETTTFAAGKNRIASRADATGATTAYAYVPQATAGETGSVCK